jgi:hypothetical protein
MSEFTVRRTLRRKVKSNTFVPFARNPVPIQEPWLNMKESTQEKNHTHALFVLKILQQNQS